MVKNLVHHNKEIKEDNGVIVWEGQSLNSYKTLQWMVMRYIDEQDGTFAIAQKEGATPTISG